jgi:DNA modification methylase
MPNSYAYKKLKKGGTLILFFDLWKITDLKNILEKYKFKQIRFIEWIKTNPQPLNSKVNYLTNCREIALLGIKGSSPTFNSSYDTGIYDNDIYRLPLQGGKNRIHPTQKSLKLFETLIEKHSNENDLVLDTFLGGGTTAIAAKNTKRKFKGCEINKEYFDLFSKILNDLDTTENDIKKEEKKGKKTEETKNDKKEEVEQDDNEIKKLKKVKKVKKSDKVDSQDETNSAEESVKPVKKTKSTKKI